MAFAAAFLVILMATPLAFATQYPITWTTGTDYSSWATRSLNVGDTLAFTYGPTHTVDVVDKSGYDNCDASKALEKHNTGPTTITLKEGTTYIICSTPGHCQPTGGMKLQVTAKASGSSSTPSSSPAPSGSGSPSDSGSGSTPPSPPSGAGSSSASHLMLGVPLVLGTLVAFMG